MFNRFFSVCYLIFIAISSLFLFIGALLVWLLTVLFDRRLVILHLYSSIWASLYIWLMPAWSVKILNKDKIQTGKTYIIVSNHQSLLDILVAYGLFVPFKWVSKAEIFNIPFIGWNMFLNRYIQLKRGNKKSSKKMMAACEKAVAGGSSVFFFPEGTRSKNGEIRNFKFGAFHLAHKMQVAILPIVINGTKDALPKKSFTYGINHNITLTIMDEIPYEDFATMSIKETSDLVRNKIIKQFHNSYS